MATQEAPKIKIAKATLGDMHMSPRKVRLVTDMVKHKRVDLALEQLQFMSKKAAGPVIKLINSAVANAVHNFQMNAENLVLKNITVNQGRVTQRFMPRAQGRAFPLNRRTSIVEVTLEEVAQPKSGKSKRKVVKPSKPAVQAPVEEDTKSEENAAIDEKTQKKTFTAKTEQHKPSRLLNIKKRLFDRKTNA